MHTNIRKKLFAVFSRKFPNRKVKLDIEGAGVECRGIAHGKIVSDRGVKISSELGSATKHIQQVTYLYTHSGIDSHLCSRLKKTPQQLVRIDAKVQTISFLIKKTGVHGSQQVLIKIPVRIIADQVQ